MPFRIGYASGVGRLVFIPSSLSPQRAWAVRTAAAARGTHCNSEALTVNEWRVARGGTGHFWSGQSHWRHSESICGHPWPSVAQGMSSDANRCTQMQLHSGASSCTQLRTAANSCEQLRTDANRCEQMQSVSLTLAAGMWPSATSSSTRVATTSVRSELEVATGASSRAMPSGLLPLTLLLVGGQST